MTGDKEEISPESFDDIFEYMMYSILYIYMLLVQIYPRGLDLNGYDFHDRKISFWNRVIDVINVVEIFHQKLF